MFSNCNNGQRKTLSASLKAGILRRGVLDHHSRFYLRKCVPFGGIWEGSLENHWSELHCLTKCLICLVNYGISEVITVSDRNSLCLFNNTNIINNNSLLARKKVYLVFDSFLAMKSYSLYQWIFEIKNEYFLNLKW